MCVSSQINDLFLSSAEPSVAVSLHLRAKKYNTVYAKCCVS